MVVKPISHLRLPPRADRNKQYEEKIRNKHRQKYKNSKKMTSLGPACKVVVKRSSTTRNFQTKPKIQMVETMEMRESAEMLESLSLSGPGLEQGLEPVSSRVAGIPGARQQIIYNIETNLEAVYKEYGEPEVIRVRENKPNRSRRSGLVVRIEASTVSFTDCLIRRNITKDFFRAADLPNSPGVDFVGKGICISLPVLIPLLCNWIQIFSFFFFSIILILATSRHRGLCWRSCNERRWFQSWR